MKGPNFLMLALMIGAVFGVITSLPYLLCCCCLWYLLGPFTAAAIQGKRCRAVSAPYSAGPGAIIGIVTGIVMAIASLVVGIILHLVGVDMTEHVMTIMEQLMRPMFEGNPEALEGFEQGMADAREQQQAPGAFITGLIQGAIGGVIGGTVLGAIGGALGGVMFKSEPKSGSADSMPTPGGSSDQGPTI